MGTCHAVIHDWHLHHHTTCGLPGNCDCNKFNWMHFTPSHYSSHAWQFVIVIKTKTCSSLICSNHLNRNWHNDCKTHCRRSDHKHCHTSSHRYLNRRFFPHRISKIIQMSFYVCSRTTNTPDITQTTNVNRVKSLDHNPIHNSKYLHMDHGSIPQIVLRIVTCIFLVSSTLREDRFHTSIISISMRPCNFKMYVLNIAK